jgi:GDP-4-dehydro-6-deoxy-D-mannose reductase
MDVLPSAIPIQIIDPKHLIVTGSRGFIGQHYCARYGGIPLEDELGVVDLCDAARVTASVAALQPAAVLHLAAQSSVASSFKNPKATIDVNFLGTLNLLLALSAIGFKGVFLYVSSADVYGHTSMEELPVGELQPLRPRSPYAVSKVAAEALCYQWSQTNEFRIVLTRPFNQIGPGQDKRFAIADFAHQIAAIRRCSQTAELITGDIDITRDFTDVRDTIRAYHLLLSNGLNGEIYNICSGQERSVRFLIQALLRIARADAKIQIDYDRIRPNEQRRVVGDPSKIRTQMGWTPEIALDTTLTDILREVEENECRANTH